MLDILCIVSCLILYALLVARYTVCIVSCLIFSV